MRQRERHRHSVMAFTLPVFAILFSSTLDTEAQEGFYPPLPEAPAATATPPPPVCQMPEEFDNINDLGPNGWVRRNNTQPPGNTNWFQGNAGVFGSQSGSTNSYIAANFQNGSGVATISNWLITPPVILQNNGQLSFWTRTVNRPLYPDRLQVRMSLNGTSSDVGNTSTSVGDFTIVLFDINPAYSLTGYPGQWTQVVATLSGIDSPVTGRFALRYFVEGAGPNGGNSDYIGIDSVQYCCTSECGFPTPTPVPSPTITPTPTPTGTPCSCGGLNVSGKVYNCSKTSRSAPVPNVTLTVSVNGSFDFTTVSGTDGFYNFHVDLIGFMPGAGVTPSKASLLPGSTGIDTLDVIVTQKHFLGITPLTGCSPTTADVNQDGTVNTQDVVAIQRFFLGLSTGVANVGKFSFSPSHYSYPVCNCTFGGQNFSAVLFGDVAEPFVP